MLRKYALHITSILLILFATSAFADKKYSDLFIFGDSLSDTGNAAILANENLPDPPFYQNRITNGPVAVEYLANSLQLKANPSLSFINNEFGTNFAVAGATARDDLETQNDLTTQVDAFIYRMKMLGQTAPPDALYVIFIGGNDIRDARIEFDPLASMQIIKDAVAAIDENIRKLIDAGAKHIQVVNAPDIGAIPETALIADIVGVPLLPVISTAKTLGFNYRLFWALRIIEYQTGVKLKKFNLFRTFSYLLDNAEKLDISNTTDPCYDFTTTPWGACLDVNAYFFFDAIHPTAKVHKAIGAAMIKNVKHKRIYDRAMRH